MHYGQDVIAKAGRYTRAFEDYRAEHCLLLGYGAGPVANGQTRSGDSPKNQVVYIKKRPAKRGVLYFDQTAD